MESSESPDDADENATAPGNDGGDSDAVAADATAAADSAPTSDEAEAPVSEVDDGDESPEADSEVTLESLGADLEAARAEIEGLKDRALRAAAEAENVRKRADRRIENAHKFALERFAADLLPVVDSFDRALDTAEALAIENEAFGGTVEGIKLSLKLMAETLGRHGIEAIDPVGEPFDPTYHEAMSMIENPDAEPGSVLQVVQKGYSLNERLVRPARVLVAAGTKASANSGTEPPTDA